MMEKDLDALNGRFIQAMESLGHTGYSLSKDLGTSEAVISNIRNRKNPPNIQLIRELLNKYLDLDPEWLLFGRGSMRRSQAGPGTERSAKPGGITLASIDQRVAGLEQLIKRSLNAQLERSVVVDETVSDLEQRIATLEKGKEPVRKRQGTKR